MSTQDIETQTIQLGFEKENKSATIAQVRAAVEADIKRGADDGFLSFLRSGHDLSVATTDGGSFTMTRHKADQILERAAEKQRKNDPEADKTITVKAPSGRNPYATADVSVAEARRSLKGAANGKASFTDLSDRDHTVAQDSLGAALAAYDGVKPAVAAATPATTDWFGPQQTASVQTPAAAAKTEEKPKAAVKDMTHLTKHYNAKAKRPTIVPPAATLDHADTGKQLVADKGADKGIDKGALPTELTQQLSSLAGQDPQAFMKMMVSLLTTVLNNKADALEQTAPPMAATKRALYVVNKGNTPT